MKQEILLSNFGQLTYSQKKEKLLYILTSGDASNASTIDLIGFINSLPEGSNESLVDIYKSMVLSANEFSSNKNIISGLDRGINQMKKYEMDLDQEKDREEADEILKHIF